MFKKNTKVNINGKNTPVLQGVGVPKKHFLCALESAHFTNSVERLNANGKFSLTSLTIENVTMFGPNPGFVVVSAQDLKVNEKTVPNTAFNRGNSVCTITKLNCQGAEFLLFTNQARFPIAKSQYKEIPAGCGTGKNKAYEEIKEETGLDVDINSIVELGAPLYSTPGGSDEALEFSAVEIEISPEQLGKLPGSETGLATENEFIFLSLEPLEIAVKRYLSGECIDAKEEIAMSRARNLLGWF